ncbi:MAG: iron-containing redox enzyme family protein, partial [Candidatus Eremiobacteraeota bacterium]|nr:iron-containing redox enzyme family protein [Candidatus Eremiobacteraeota bacterium]
PELRALLDIMWRLVYNEPWQVWLATQAAMESQMVGVQARTIPALQRHYGFAAGDDRVEWFEEHLVADVEHGEKAFALVERHVEDPAMAARCKAAVAEALDARWRYVDAVYRTYVADVPEASRA